VNLDQPVSPLTPPLHTSSLTPSQTGEGTAVKEEETKCTSSHEVYVAEMLRPDALPGTNQHKRHPLDLILSSPTNTNTPEGLYNVPLKT